MNNFEEKVNEATQELLSSEELGALEGGVEAMAENMKAIVRQGVSHCCNGSASQDDKLTSEEP